MTDTAGGDTRIAELESRLEREVRLRRRFVDIATKLTSTLNQQDLLGMVMQSATELLDAETSSLMLHIPETGELEIEIATGGVGGQIESQRIPAGKGIAGWVLEHQEPAVVNDPASDERFYSDVSTAVGFETRNLLAVPMTSRERPVGIVEVINKDGGFAEEDVEVARGFASLAAIALENAQTYSKLADAVLQARMSYRF